MKKHVAIILLSCLFVAGCARNGGYSASVKAVTPDENYIITLSGEQGTPLRALEEQTQIAARESCNGAFLLRGMRINTHADESYTVISEIDCFTSS